MPLRCRNLHSLKIAQGFLSFYRTYSGFNSLGGFGLFEFLGISSIFVGILYQLSF